MTGAAELLSLAWGALWIHFVVFLRVGPVMSLFPGFGERSVPVRIKLMLALGFTVIVTPVLAPRLTGSADMAFGLLVVAETGVGLVIGIGVRLFLLALQTAGSMAAQATSLSQILGSASVTPLPAMGHLLVVAALALSMMLGLHIRVAEMVILTYDILPVGRLPDAATVTQWGVGQVASAFSLAFGLAAPFVIVSVIYNLALGVINRAMPQLMVVFVGAPVITAAGLVLLMLLAPVMLTVWMTAFDRFITNPFGAG